MTSEVPGVQPKNRFLIASGDPGLRDRLALGLSASCPGASVDRVGTCRDAAGILGAAGADLLFLDVDLPGPQGPAFIGQVRELSPETAVVILLEAGGEDQALEFIRLGATEYLLKDHCRGRTLGRVVRYALERKQWEGLMVSTEARRRESERLFACTLDAMKAAIALADEKGVLVAANTAWKSLDLSLNPLVPSWDLGQRDYAAFCRSLAGGPDPVSRAAAGFLKVLEGIEPKFVSDFRWGEGPGALGLGVTFFGFLAEGSRRTGIAIADVTARLRTERNLRENQEVFRLLTEFAADLVALVDRNGERVYQNPAYSRALGYSVEELAKLSPAELLHPDDREAIGKLREGLFRSGREISASYRMRHKDGSWRHFEGRAAVILEGREEPRLAVLVARDVTERTRADHEFMAASAVKAIVLENSSLGLAYVRHQTFEWCNSRLAEMLGRAIGEIQGASTRILCGDDASYGELVARIYGALDVARSADITWRLVRGNGDPFWCRFIGRPIDPAHVPEGSVWIFEDITERVEAEQRRLALEVQLRHAQKLEAIGQLAAGIAHEINTPIQYIGDNARFLREAFQDLMGLVEALEGRFGAEALQGELEAADVPFLRGEVPKALLETQDGINRVAKIVRAMKEFSHPGGEDPVEVDLNRSIESTVTVSRNEWKYVADLELDLDPDLAPVMCYPDEVNQAVLNLVVNAAHAIAEANAGDSEAKGTIRVGTRQRGDRVEIRVADSGTGIPEAIQARIYDPFFTTKPVGRGTGQGLALVHATVVERHKGSIRFETGPGRGTTFILELPLAGPARGGEADHG